VNFLLDENMPPSLAAVLIDTGHHAIHVRDLKLTGKPDETIFTHAADNNFIIVIPFII